MGKRVLLEDLSAGSPVLDISRAAGPTVPNISRSPLDPACNLWHTLGLPCKIKCTFSHGCILSFLEEASPRGTRPCLSPEKGSPLLCAGKGCRGVGKHPDLSLW